MIKIALLLTLTSLTGLNAPSLAFSSAEEEPPGTETVETMIVEASEKESAQSTNEPKSEKEIVLDYFKDVPIMIEIARCESNFRHSNKNGGVLRGIANSQDVGVMQVNEHFHLERSEKLGINIYTIEGNLEFAKYLYDKEGTRPWNASKKCWNK